MRVKRGSVPIILGLLLIAAALCVAVYNVWENRSAARHSEEAVSVLTGQIPEEPSALPLEDEAASGGEVEIPDHILAPDMEMPVLPMDGMDYIGILELPALDLTLPVISEWSYPALKLAPCRFTGSVWEDDLVVMAHNYDHHFGKLSSLSFGDAVYFTDSQGLSLHYQVAATDVLSPIAVTEVTDNAYDLTLFTCTYGGKHRIVVYCEKVWETEKCA